MHVLSIGDVYPSDSSITLLAEVVQSYDAIKSVICVYTDLAHRTFRT